MYHKYNWPPSPYILPFFISMHISKTDFYMIEDDFLDSDSAEYFKKYGMIGCRDKSTLELLHARGIEAYFSGCLTLTIEKKKNVSKRDIIYCVDVEEDVVSKIKAMGEQYKVERITHDIKPEKDKFDWKIRKNRVEELLEKYQSAKCVITTRLHCALPCLALETPVLLIYNEEDYFKNRMEEFLPFLYHCSKEEFLKGCDYDINHPPENRKNYLVTKRKLEAEVRGFLKQLVNKNIDVAIKDDYWFQQIVKQTKLLDKQLVKLKKLHDEAWISNELKKKSEWQEKQINWLNSKLSGTELWYQEREKWFEANEKEQEKRIQSLNEKIEQTEQVLKEKDLWYREQISTFQVNEKNKNKKILGLEEDLQKQKHYYEIREEYQNKEIEWLNRKVQGTERWYQERENWYKEEIQKCKNEVTAEKSKSEQLFSKYQEILCSKTYRIGGIIVWIPKKIISLCKRQSNEK